VRSYACDVSFFKNINYLSQSDVLALVVHPYLEKVGHVVAEFLFMYTEDCIIITFYNRAKIDCMVLLHMISLYRLLNHVF